MCRGGEYMSSHHYTDSGQKEEIPVESSKHVKGPQAENSLVDWKKGIMFYFRDEIFYREILQMFLDSHSDMELRRYYEDSDFENYRIKIHAVKTNLATSKISSFIFLKLIWFSSGAITKNQPKFFIFLENIR